ncbi:HK97 family phage prohead protease [Sphingomonas carotinifaciens]|uniref:HK97 family phage prohead protease n=1 Tax=Sphingomonas carotinifaciens TaxID=1166323 RepID=UPI0039A2D35A
MTLAFAGYAAVWDRVDRAGDVMRRGAFAGAGPVPLLWRHRGHAVGRIDGLREDATGLWTWGRIDDPALAPLVRNGTVAGLSVGYRPGQVMQGARRAILAATLVEVSVVAVPMQPLARICEVSCGGVE